MKRILFLVALCALAFAGTRKVDAADVSIDFFYNNLGGGSWIEAGDYGYCWQPEIAVSNRDWRPYADGYWAYTDVGWTWVSYEDFGWATYHYGRWARLRDHGWVWVPGYEWGPAWVSWRTGGDYVGWAPLPPRRYGHGGGEVVFEGRSIGTSVDIEFDIGPAYYNFVDVRYIGAPVLREHIYAPAQNITYINRTVNVTNITYNNATIYNHGPDYNRLSAYSTRPIQRLTLQREAATDLTMAAQSRGLTKVQGDRLVVAAPPALQKPAQPIAPKVVKTRVAKPDVETGWMGVSDPNAKAQLQEKMKKEDPKSVPPPQIPARNPEALSAAAAPSPGAGAAVPTAGQPGAATGVGNGGAAESKGRGKGKRGDDAASQPADGNTPPPGTDVGAAASTPADAQRGKGRGRDRQGRDQAQPPEPAAVAEQNPAATVPRQDEVKGRGKRDPQLPPAPAAVDPASQPSISAPPAAAPGPAGAPDDNRGGRDKKERRGNLDRPATAPRQPSERPAELQPGINRGPAAPTAPAEGAGRGRGNQKRDQFDAPPPQAAPQEQPRGRKERPPGREAAAPQGLSPGAPAPAPQREGKPDRGNKKEKKDEEPKKP